MLTCMTFEVPLHRQFDILKVDYLNINHDTTHIYSIGNTNITVPIYSRTVNSIQTKMHVNFSAAR